MIQRRHVQIPGSHFGWLRNYSLSVAAATALTPQEFRAVLAHELVTCLAIMVALRLDLPHANHGFRFLPSLNRTVRRCAF